jgi:hypothetical protein
MKTLYLLPALLLAGACQQNSLSKVMYPQTTDPRNAQTAYCYKALTDIICYSNPQPHLSNPLQGVQLAEDSRSVDTRKTRIEQWAEKVYYNVYKEDPRNQQPAANPPQHTRASMAQQQPQSAIMLSTTAPDDAIMVTPLAPVTDVHAPAPLLGAQ